MFNWKKEHLLITLAVLFILTFSSWIMIYSAALEPRILGAFLLLLAFVKVQLIISQYMELNKAIPIVQIAFWVWTTGTCAMSVTMYLL